MATAQSPFKVKDKRQNSALGVTRICENVLVDVCMCVCADACVFLCVYVCFAVYFYVRYMCVSVIAPYGYDM